MEPIQPLSQPVGASMRPIEPLDAHDSIARAAATLRESAASFLPVLRDGRLIGVVTERSLAKALAMGLGPLSSADTATESEIPTITPFATGAEALRRLAETEEREIAVVDADGRFLGVVAASDLFPRMSLTPHLPMIGGMATPFGVYLTAGGVRAGASHLALVSTGMLLFTLYLAATAVGYWAADRFPAWFGTGPWPSWAYEGVPFLLFLIGMRLIPLSGTHAAEHKVVHALERGEPLELEVVRRMPRVHPRCGTNLAVGASLFLGLSGWNWVGDQSLRLIVAMLATLVMWRPLGNLVQSLITTKPPTDRQLMSGIRAGKELIRDVQQRRQSHPSFGRRLLATGMPHVMGGSLLMWAVAEGVARAFGRSLTF